VAARRVIAAVAEPAGRKLAAARNAVAVKLELAKPQARAAKRGAAHQAAAVEEVRRVMLRNSRLAPAANAPAAQLPEAQMPPENRTCAASRKHGLLSAIADTAEVCHAGRGTL
jgi:hypothetical protein